MRCHPFSADIGSIVGHNEGDKRMGATRKRRLTAAFVRSVDRPGVYGDEHGLRLRVYQSRKRRSISKQRIWRGTVNGARRDAGLGAFPYVTLAEARQTAFEYRTIARAGGDPLALKRRPDMPTFAEAVETAISIHREGWKDAKTSEKQWRASLRDYAMPRLGQKRVDQITTADVMAVLIPHWHTKRETMQRVRQRIGTVMKWAVAQGYRDGQSHGRRHLRSPAEERWSAPASARVAVQGSGRRAPQGEEVGCVRAHGSRLRVSSLDGLPVRRGSARDLGRGRSRIGDVDGARESDEVEARPSGSAIRSRARSPAGGTRIG